MVRSIGSLAFVLALAAFGAACSNNSPTTATATVSAIAVNGSVPAVGSTSQFTATATMSDGTTKDVTSAATWQSSNSADATVSSTGMVTGVAGGSVTVTATYQSVTGSDQFTIPSGS